MGHFEWISWQPLIVEMVGWWTTDDDIAKDLLRRWYKIEESSRSHQGEQWEPISSLSSLAVDVPVQVDVDVGFDVDVDADVKTFSLDVPLY